MKLFKRFPHLPSTASTISAALSLPYLPLNKTELKAFFSTWKRVNAKEPAPTDFHSTSIPTDSTLCTPFTAGTSPVVSMAKGASAPVSCQGVLQDADLIYEAMLELFLRDSSWVTPLLSISSEVAPTFTVKFDPSMMLKVNL